MNQDRRPNAPDLVDRGHTARGYRYSSLMTSDNQWFELSTVIRALRAQLNEALAEGEKDEIRFELGPVELDFEVGVNSKSGVKGGLQIHVLSFGANGSKSRESTNRMKLVLKPVDRAGNSPLVGDTAKSIPSK